MASGKITTVQVSSATAGKLKTIKKLTKQPVGTLADIGLTYVCERIHEGTLVVENGKIVPRELAGA